MGTRLATLGPQSKAHIGKFVGFVKLVVQQFLAHRDDRNAAALTFTTLLSLVPLMTVSLAIFYAFPAAEEVNAVLQDFLFQNFMPTAGEVLQQHLDAFISKASSLSGPSFAVLIAVALLLMSNIDQSLNTIWEVRAKRGFVSKFLTYWAVLTLGPLLITASVLATSKLVILAGMAHSPWWEGLLKLAPVSSSLLAFTLIYGLVPNVRVKFSHALIGGAVAALLFELAKRLFAFYLQTFPTYEAIYGALATVPIFLVWLYLTWTIVLIGAEVAHGLRLYHWNKPNPRGVEPGFSDAVYLLLLLDEASAQGRALSLWEITASCDAWREDRIANLLADMQERHWAHQTADGSWSLARRLNDLTLYEVLMQGRYPLPKESDVRWDGVSGLADRFQAARSGAAGALDVALAEFRLRRADTPSLVARQGG